MANIPQKKLRWDRIILMLLLLVGAGVGIYMLIQR
jgi:hypothetical protein